MPYDFPIRYGKYYLSRRIAVGGMAEVFKAKLIGIKGFEKTFAVKKILPEFSEDEEFVQMFVDEARISSNLHHNNIVQVYDFGKVESSYYIAMEYIDGVNLKNLLQRHLKNKGSFPRTLAYYILMQLARALDYAHNVHIDENSVLNLVHRDVSPQNVLVARNGEIKITDFGIAKAAIKLSKTQPGKIQGKFSYMSPEQAAGKTIDRRSDIFSLGILAFELFSGLKAYGTEDTQLKYKEIKDAKITRLGTLVKGLPSQVESLIMQMLSKDPNDRPQTCYEIATQFSDFLNDVPMAQLSSDVGQLVDELYPKEKSDPVVSKRLLEMAERDLSGKPKLVVELETPKEKTGQQTQVIHGGGEEPTVANWQIFLLKTPIGRLTLISILLAITATAAYVFRSQNPPRQPTPDLIEDRPNPIPDHRKETTLKIADLENKLKDSEERATKSQKELLKAERKLELAQKVDRAPPPACPPDMVLIPSGTFYFGSDKGDPLRSDATESIATLIPNSRFCIDRLEQPVERGVLPTTKVSWAEAQALCSKEKERLCTQEEWERACKGSPTLGNFRFPYGNQFDSNKCNTERKDRVTGEFHDRNLAKSGSFPSCVSAEGVFDLSGNADEWTSTSGRYSQSSRVTKGGSSRRPDWASRCSSYREVPEVSKENDLGFRCCKDAL